MEEGKLIVIVAGPNGAGKTTFFDHYLKLSLPSVDYSLARVAARVLQGGHNIPESDIRRRFDKGTGNFYNLMRDLVDYWFLFDNSAQPPRLIDSGANDHGES